MSTYPRDAAYTAAAEKLLASRAAFFAGIRAARQPEEIDAVHDGPGREYEADLAAVRAEEDRILAATKKDTKRRPRPSVRA